jgi:hypothetical protein
MAAAWAEMAKALEFRVIFRLPHNGIEYESLLSAKCRRGSIQMEDLVDPRLPTRKL